MRLKGRVAIITGAAQGIGKAIVQEFSKEGATAVAIDQKAEVKEVCRQIQERGAKATAYVFDISDKDAYRKCVEDTAEREKKIDILVNDAAVIFYGNLLEDRLDLWQRTMAVNLEAIYWGCKLVAPYMAKQGWGRIVSITSVEAIATQGLLGAYCAAKGGIISFTKSLAVDLAPHGILANAIAPGCIHTPLSIIDGVDETETELFKTWYVGKRKIPLARPGQPEEIAKAAVFLASEDCSYVTGHTLVVDGGLTITT
jgi:NAD(P)-dependent dehydrogenase (short-subunit alcohol dehydrogenase family)